MDLFSLKDRKIFILGGSGLIGKSSSKLLKEEGAKITNFDLKNNGKISDNFYRLDLRNSNKIEKIFFKAKDKTAALDHFYNQLADKYNVNKLNAGDFIETSETDGVHFEPEAHKILGKTVADYILENLA